MGEDTGRTARLHDINALRADLEQHAKEDRQIYGELKDALNALKVESADQNGKLDTLVARTEGKIELLDERTNNLTARTRSRERLDEKARDTQERIEEKAKETALVETRNIKEHRRGVIRLLLGGLVATGGGLIHWILGKL